jgi:hypothetical protein
MLCLQLILRAGLKCEGAHAEGGMASLRDEKGGTIWLQHTTDNHNNQHHNHP